MARPLRPASPRMASTMTTSMATTRGVPILPTCWSTCFGAMQGLTTAGKWGGRWVVIDGMSRLGLRDGLICDYSESVNGGVAMAQLGVAAPRIKKVLQRWAKQLRERPAVQAYLQRPKGHRPGPAQ